jgi:hypothetical protein
MQASFKTSVSTMSMQGYVMLKNPNQLELQSGMGYQVSNLTFQKVCIV